MHTSATQEPAILCVVNTWETDQAARIGAEVKRLREGRSAAWLSERTEQLGLKLTRQTITDLENGRRRYVTTAELTVLAVALGTSPVGLVYPGPYGNEVEVLPGRNATEFIAAQWFSGLIWSDFAKVGEGNQSSQEWSAATNNLGLWRSLAEYELDRSKARFRMLSENRINDTDSRELLAVYDKRIDELREQLGLSDDV